MPSQLLAMDRLSAGLPDAAAQYAAAVPFPHTVLDDVLTPEAFAAAVEEFPGTEDPFWRGYLHVNETKYSNTAPDTWGPTLRAVARELCAPEFVAYLERLTGIEDLLPDWSMDGGGLHQTLRGGHLNIHADFTTHHERENWARRVNILLYLNEEWHPEWGGELELWDRQMTARQGTVTPKGNRMLVFTTSFDSFHGHPDPLTCPPGEARRSMALYYFTEEAEAVRRSTNYRARPTDGAGRGAAIWADRTALDVYDRAKRRLGLRDETVQGLLGRLQRLRRRG
ncbi:2OG-Fe(II) oxygenase [Phycicoccus sonneratiae]|uniref:2OG-Fe(II) oxygenase n=1 Tax=Phycicoccus sonneratiae TaxID=2807628 RepID=A0ABS2CJZ2_9MICO|nr:2OG-Fe(II) oxygenase [Phycicoccus sonneraticus]MBM6399491.1 2OG-Fe(II) oxygenase [Phycicoccus sonneraticus]